MLILLVISYLQMISIKKRRLAEREDIEPDRFYSLFYDSSALPKKIVIQILETIATATEMPINKLRPQDRFDRELKPVKGWEFDDGINLLSVETKKLLEKNRVQIDLTEIKTIDDYIRHIAPLLVNKEDK
jgi:hypothetical protein